MDVLENELLGIFVFDEVYFDLVTGFTSAWATMKAKGSWRF